MINRILLPNLVLADPVLENVDFRVSDISGGESLNAAGFNGPLTPRFIRS